MGHFGDRLRLGEDVRVDAAVAEHRPGTREHRQALLVALSNERWTRIYNRVFDYTRDQYRELIRPPEQVDDFGVVGALAEVERPGTVEREGLMSWYVGGRAKHRTLHRERCGYKRQPYPWAADATEEELVAVIRRAGPMAVWAHRGCKFCCRALHDGLDQARTEIANPFVDNEEEATG